MTRPTRGFSARIPLRRAGLVLAAFTVLGVSPSTTPTPPSDLYVSGLVLYTRLPADSPDAKRHGVNPEVKSYDLHGGLAPDKVDAVVVANGVASETITLVLEVVPVVGLTNWEATEGITDTQLLEASKTRFPAFVRLEKKVVLKGRTQVEFKDIDLAAILGHYRKIRLWPAELIFRVTVQPIAGETSLSNNVMELTLPVHPPD